MSTFGYFLIIIINIANEIGITNATIFPRNCSLDCIDKELPNTRTEIKVPVEEVEIKEEIKEQLPVEVTPEEDGGATINFEPGAINIPGTEKHFDN